MREIGGTGAILGRFSEATFEEQRIELQAGDRLVLYTDGITEALNPAGEMFAERRLQTVLAESDSLSAEGFCTALMAALDGWTESASDTSHEDDLTLLVVDIGPDRSTAV